MMKPSVKRCENVNERYKVNEIIVYKMQWDRHLQSPKGMCEHCTGD